MFAEEVHITLTSLDVPGLDRNPCGWAGTVNRLHRAIAGRRDVYVPFQRKPKPLLYWVQLVSTKPALRKGSWGSLLSPAEF